MADDDINDLERFYRRNKWHGINCDLGYAREYGEENAMLTILNGFQTLTKNIIENVELKTKN